MLAALLAQIAVALGTPIQLAVGRVLVDRIAVGSSGVIPISILLVSVMLLTRLSALANSSLVTIVRDHSAADAVRRFLEKSASIDAGYFNDSTFLDRMRHAGDVAEERFSLVIMGLWGLVGALVGVAGLATLIASISPLIAIPVVLSMFPWILSEQRAFNMVRKARLSLLSVRRRQSYLRGLVTDPDSSLELLAYGSGRSIADRHHKLSVEILDKERPAHIRQFMTMGAGGLVASAFLAAAFIGLTGLTLSEKTSPGDIAAMVGGLAAFTMTTSLFSNSISGLLAHGPYLADYFEFLETPPLLRVEVPPRKLPSKLDEGIVLDNVTYSYPGGNHAAVRGVSLRLRPGEMVALVGENGAGKSTLVKLLLRFYDPDSGSIFIDGIDMRLCDPADIRSMIGVVFQDFARYQMTLRETLAIGNPDDRPRDGRLEAALTAAGLDRLLKSLPEGLDSNMGRLFPGGQGLSGGQWQRLALARLYYRNPNVLILDEPTSSLDPRGEFAMFTEVRKRLQGRIGLLISHRFSTVRAADRIAVMHEGELIEEGTHSTLMELQGHYARLFELQEASLHSGENHQP